MSKDRSTTAKRQQEVAKRRKAAEKQGRGAERKQRAASSGQEWTGDLSPEERAVLKTFRKFLITPGRMLCFYGPELAAFTEPLEALSEKGLLIAEKFRGGYSLTESGYSAMQSTP